MEAKVAAPVADKKAVLLVNLGTPSAPTPQAVGRYLREFLMDPLVINRPTWLRWLLVKGVIVPLRAKKSSRLYKSIWTKAGSPLLVNSLALADKLQGQLGRGISVFTAMRYGQPSLASAIQKIQQQGFEHVQVMLMYPQYAQSTTQTALDKIKPLIEKAQLQASYLSPFYDKPDFINAYAKHIKEFKNSCSEQAQYTLFSFHGLPEEQIKSLNPECGPCLKKTLCEKIKLKTCYRAQCVATAQALANALELDKANYSITFQSRLGKLPWLQPYTQERIIDLAQQGVKCVQVITPSFTADCLETLEEIKISLAATFKQHGGYKLQVAPCLNASDSWVKVLGNWAAV